MQNTGTRWMLDWISFEHWPIMIQKKSLGALCLHPHFQNTHRYHNSAFEKILDADQAKYGDRASYTIASSDGDEYQGTVDAVIG